MLALGFLLILPTIVTLVVSSRPWEHLLWLLAYSVGAYSFLVLAPATSLSQVERGDAAALLLVAIVISFVGSVQARGSRTRPAGAEPFIGRDGCVAASLAMSPI